jgi:hypothetical protein
MNSFEAVGKFEAVNDRLLRPDNETFVCVIFLNFRD